MKTTEILTWMLIGAAAIHSQTSGAQRIDVTFTGGHETEPQDHGRPDVLIAAALGVPTQVFREAFSHVTPARGGAEPEPAQVQRNHALLMRALAPYGVTGDKLNTVSNYYRYNRSAGEQVWRVTPAAAYATVRDGVVTGFTITDPGSGYSSEPIVAIPGMPAVKITVKIGFHTDFKRNGSIEELALAQPPHGLY